MNLAENRKARFNYEIVDNYEAGIVLSGWEVKSARNKNLNMAAAWVKIDKGEAWIHNFQISPWSFGDMSKQDPFQIRKLLLHKKEILKMEQGILEKKMTIVPLRLYLKKGRIKCELGLAKGRKKHEKKQVLKERSQMKEARKALKDL